MSKPKTKKSAIPTTGFISFSSVITTSEVESNLHTSGTVAGSIPSPVYTGDDTELQSVFKKLLKKDAGTRKKALSDMQSIITDRGPAIVYGAMSHFVYVFNKLILDNDRLVREQLIKTLGQLISVDMRALGSFRKNVIGWVWISDSDPSSNVAQAAINVIEMLAPTEKRETVIRNMLPSILEQIQNVLSHADYQGLSDLSSCSVEDAEERFERYYCLSFIQIYQ